MFWMRMSEDHSHRALRVSCAFGLTRHSCLSDVAGFTQEGGNADVETEAQRGEVTRFPQGDPGEPGLERGRHGPLYTRQMR